MNANATAKLTNRTGVHKNLTKIHRIIRRDETVEIPVQQALEFVNRPGWEVTLPEGEVVDDDGRLALYFIAPFGVADGYGNHAEDIALFLDRGGVKLTARHLWQLNPAGLQRRTLELLQAPLATVHAVGVCMATPGEFHWLPTAYRVGLTMYESTDYRLRHPEWTWQINEMDMLLTIGNVGERSGECDEWNYEMFRHCGVRVPIGIIPGAGNRHFYLPENKWILTPDPSPRGRGEFVVVTWGAMSSRKAPLEMIDVFKRAFPIKKYPNFRFRIKTVGGLVGDGQPGSYRPDDSRIEIISADWLPAQMVEFARSANVMLYLSHGEGNGRPPREAMAMGLPLICADNSGMRPICVERFMTPVETHHWEAAPIGGQWAVADLDQAVEALRWHYEHQAKAAEKAALGATWIAKHYSPEVQAQSIADCLRGQVDMTVAKSRQGRQWTTTYRPATDHTPAVELLRRRVQPPARVTVFGPGELMLALRVAGYDACLAQGAPLETPVNGKIQLGRIGDALGAAQVAVVAVPSAHYPVRERGDEWLAGLNDWERLLEARPAEIDTASGTAGFNVEARKTYGGDGDKDYICFVIVPGKRVRGTLVR